MDWPGNILLYVLLVVAVAIGFLLGRRERRPKKSQTAVIKDYYQGLNFLLGDRPELGVDKFIQAMEVSDESIDVHLALASVVRRRGEVDKAIRIHQNLLASPALKTANKQLIEFELARDYHAAGLLDRAEGLLRDIVARRDAQEKQAVDLLLDIYEQERDWQQAIVISKRASNSDNAQKLRLSHFHCELGESCLKNGEVKLASEHARGAVQVDPSNPRGHWLLALVESSQKRHKLVLRSLRRVAELQPNLGEELLELFARSAEAMGREHEYLEFLEQALQRSASAKVVGAVLAYQRKHGQLVDYERMLALIGREPRSEHLPMLLDVMKRSQQGIDTENGQNLEGVARDLMANIVVEVDGHQCSNCGFTSAAHLWHCPTCKAWGSFSDRAV